MFLPHLVRKTLHFDQKGPVGKRGINSSDTTSNKERRWVDADHHDASGAASAAAEERAASKQRLQSGARAKKLPLGPLLLTLRSLMKGLVVRELHCSAAMCRNFRCECCRHLHLRLRIRSIHSFTCTGGRT